MLCGVCWQLLNSQQRLTMTNVDSHKYLMLNICRLAGVKTVSSAKPAMHVAKLEMLKCTALAEISTLHA